MTPLMANPDSRSKPFRNHTILVIDSSHDSADTYQHLLKHEAGVSYRVLTERYEGQILTLCQSHLVDVILLASHFPDTRGFEVLDLLKAQRGECCPPIIMIDSGDAEIAVQALKAGAVDYLVRERLNPEKLCQALSRAIAQRVNSTFDITDAVIEDITTRKRREAHLTFLSEIAHDFSRLSTADEIMQVVGAKIGAYLKITTCNFTNVDEARGEVRVDYGWNSTDVPSTVGTFGISQYLSEEFERASRAGETVVVRNTQTDPRTDAPGYAALNIYSFVTVPFHHNGRWTHYIAICDSRPRDWRDDEIELIEEISNRIFPRLERAHTEAALRQSEQRFRLMADAVPQIVWITDAQGRVEFFNKQWSDYTGVPYEPTTAAEVAASFVHPDDGARTIEAFNEARCSGDAFLVEHRIRSAAGTYRWFLVRAEPYRDQQTGEIVRWFGASVDIHDHKRLEANVTFLAEIMADFTPLKTADEIMRMTCAKTIAYLNLSRCLLVKISDAMDEAEVVYDSGVDDLPSLVGTYPIADFHTEDEMQELAAGRAIVVNDTAAAPRTAEAADKFARLQIAALVNASYVSDGQLKFVLSAMQTEPRVWCSDEIELLQELSARVCLRIERAQAEAALRQNESKYRTLFNSMDEGFCIVQIIFDEAQKPIDYRFIEINPAFEQQTGLKNAIGRTICELVPNIEPFWVDIYGTVAFTGEPTRFINHAESMGRWFDVYAFRIGEPQEHKVAVLFNDISDRKKSEQERERFLAVGSDFQVITSMDGYFRWVSPSFERLLGWTQEEMTSRPWTDFVHPDDINPSVSETDSLFSGNETFAFENRYRHKDGSYRWLLWNAQAYPDEQVIYGAAVDITPRKQAEAAITADLRDTQLLRDLSARFTTEANTQVLYDEILATAIALMRADAGSFQFLNKATQELLLLATQGFDQAMIGRFDRVAASFNTSCGIALATGKRAFVDYDVPEGDDPDGFLRVHVDAGLLSAQSTPLISRKGKLLGMVSTHWRTHHRPNDRELQFLDLLARQAADLIEQRQDEAFRKQLLEKEQAARKEAERANRIKDEFLSILSHELRSPLNPILGWCRLLQTRKFDEAKTAQALATIERNAKLQTQLIDDLLDVARILRGKLSLNETPINLVSVIESAIEVVRTAAEAKSILLRLELADRCLVRGDGGRLQQIIWNLLSNAIKFTPTGGRVDIRLESMEGHAQVTITDTGRGISPKFLPHIFESFRQEDASITRQHGGLGLGLSIVKYLVDAHGGTITADSLGEGQGATFTVTLPLLNEESVFPLTDPLLSAEIDLGGVKVLAVDDSEDARELLAVLLTHYGAEVRVVTSGEELLAERETFKPDVLVCDIGMPDMDGYTLIQKIRSLTPEQGKDIPAIAVTAFASGDAHRRALDNGFQRHMAKPIEPELLAIAIAELASLTQASLKA